MEGYFSSGSSEPLLGAYGDIGGTGGTAERSGPWEEAAARHRERSHENGTRLASLRQSLELAQAEQRRAQEEVTEAEVQASEATALAADSDRTVEWLAYYNSQIAEARRVQLTVQRGYKSSRVQLRHELRRHSDEKQALEAEREKLLQAVEDANSEVHKLQEAAAALTAEATEVAKQEAEAAQMELRARAEEAEVRADLRAKRASLEDGLNRSQHWTSTSVERDINLWQQGKSDADRRCKELEKEADALNKAARDCESRAGHVRQDANATLEQVTAANDAQRMLLEESATTSRWCLRTVLMFALAALLQGVLVAHAKPTIWEHSSFSWWQGLGFREQL